MSNEQECQCGQAHGACNTEFQYAVKVVCGRMPASPAGGAATPVAPGQYWTAVNIHNPDKCKGARFRWKVAVGRPGEPGPISAYQIARVLEPDRALEIDTRQILNSLAPPAQTFVKGYVVIESDIELDVVAVYSSAQTPAGPVNTFHTERVRARCVPVCEDLVLPLHTGITDWRTVAAISGPLGSAVPINPHPIWGPPPFGSRWVSQLATDGQNAVMGARYYDLCFDLCYGFTMPRRFEIELMADDNATLLLNGNLIGNTPYQAFYSPPTRLTVNPQFLRPGRNCFRLIVNNIIGATGFALAGILRVAGGKCPCSPLPLVPLTQGGGLPTAAELAADESEESPVSPVRKKAARKGAKKSQGRKRAVKKAVK